MTPQRREKIEAMLRKLEDHPRAHVFEEAGGTIILAPQTNTARFAGVSSTCTWNKDQHLIEGWMRIARRKIAAANRVERR
ncbi:MAG: hypothetical protein K2W86_14845 [Sphingomonas sp.]|uniref:hypothetical protein n=1 Tax=Sphingomonas sp. TaxID=28214 RepID=UPI0035A8A92B|nr:hypothetical protein [Sphingomonas sp.]